MEYFKELSAREIPITEKEKIQEILGSLLWLVYYSSRVSPYHFSPPCSSRPNNMEISLENEVNSKDRYVHLDTGTQRHPHRKKS
jgi:hypothetical protein